MEKTNKILQLRLRPVDLIISNSGFIFLAVLIIFNIIFTPNFFTINTFWNLIIHVTPVLIVAMGMTFVISSGGINIAVGSIMAISGMIVAKLLPILNLTLSLIIALVVGTVLGALSGFIIIHFDIQPIIVTLGFMIAGRGIAQMIGEGYILRFNSDRLMSLTMYRTGHNIPIQFFYVVILVLIFSFISKRTTFSRYVEAIGDNYKASYLSGLRVTTTMVAIYALSGLLSAISGILTISRTGAADPDTIGKAIEMQAIAAVAIGDTKMTGGKAKIIGTLNGAFIMQLVTTTFNMNNIPYEWSQVASTIIIIGSVFLQNIKED